MVDPMNARRPPNTPILPADLPIGAVPVLAAALRKVIAPQRRDYVKRVIQEEMVEAKVTDRITTEEASAIWRLLTAL